MSTPSKDITSDDIEARIELQELLGARILKSFENLKKEAREKRTKPFLKTKLRELQSNSRKFDDEHRCIYTALPSKVRKTNRYIAGGLYEDVIQIQSEMEIRIETWLEEIEIQSRPTEQPQIMLPNEVTINQQQQPDRLRLPKIHIEEFSGDYHKWTAFKSLFTNLVHNKTDITPVEKLYHLLSSLKGEPKKMISHYSLTNENYEAAWSSIESRYDNKRALVNHELKLLLNQPSITSESSQKIKQLLDLSNECLNALRNLDIDITSWDPIIKYILVQKIDTETHRHWENSLADPKKLPSLKSFLDFLETRFHCLENLDTGTSSTKPFNQYPNKFTPNNQNSHNNNFQQTKINSNAQSNQSHRSYANNNYNRPYKSNTTNQSQRFSRSNTTSNRFQTANDQQVFVAEVAQKCSICSGNHNVFNCTDFLNQSVTQRKTTIEQLNLCSNCLGNHNTDTCSSSKRCKQCKHRHHTMLHITTSSNSNPFSRNTNTNQTSTSSHYVEGISSKSQVLLATAMISVMSQNGEQNLLRCLLDQGSQSSFITESAAQHLRLRKTPIIAKVTGVGSVEAETSKNLVTIEMESLYDTEFKLQVDAFVLSKITGHLPTSFIATPTNWEHLNGLFLADPNFGRPSKIDLLLGADVYSEILINGLKRGSIGSPIAQHTKLGWILSGQVWNKQHREASCQPHSFHLRTDIDKELKRFWEIEELPQKRTFTQEETECERIFEETHRRDDTGRFIVALPFRQDRLALGRSRYRAEQRLNQLQSKFAKNEDYRCRYTAVMNDYMELGHMKVAASFPIARQSYYLPHHAVIKESSSTTKMRVVFDASAKTTSGESLNDQLLVGPTIQQTLSAILIRWRLHKVVLSADITKMYRQIWIREEDRKFHKLLWKSENDEHTNEYELQTVTFGTAPAAYLAIKSVQQLAKYECDRFPIASNITLRDFYVDDLLTGTDTVEEAIELQKSMVTLLASGGFELRKWITNDTNVLQQIPEQIRELALPLSFDIENTTKTLGIHYHPCTDNFQFKVQIQSPNENPTKRNLLSDTARLFDPLGWLSPVIIKAKIMLQRVWQAGYDWDDALTGDIKSDWLKYKSELRHLEDIRIPRWLGKEKHDQISLHGFCDASESAYSAVIYVKVVDNQGKSIVTMITSKTKVAPIQTISLPRLELCGAGLLAELFTFVKNALMIDVSECFAWTDSEIVLAWLRGNPTRWKTFVANRVVKILNHTNANQWRHVSSEENPADCASRGIFPNELKDHSLWWAGPNWIHNFEPERHERNREFDTIVEAKSKQITVHHIKMDEGTQLIKRYSSLAKLLRITAKVRRFAYNCRNSSMKRTGFLTTVEYVEALDVCIKIVQQNEFNTDIRRIQSGGQCISKSKLLPFNPFIDRNGILRIGGRLKNANLSFGQKHQVIIPANTHFAKLIIDDAHIRSQHGGTQITLSTIRSKFWIINSRNAVKKFVHDCMTCHRYRKASNEQLMGSLPEARLQTDRAFQRTGVDYCGPFNIKASRLRGTRIYKGYVSVFVCLSTKAVHIEVVSELSTEAFMAAFNRFVGRRGLPSDMYSDNGTNFVGADKEIHRMVKKETDFNQIYASVNKKGINWHFIPPRSPHFGGLWEAAVKSFKKHLCRIMGTTALTFEEFSTVATNIESVLNSRPLTPISDDPDDFSPLTPGHFLIGSELLAAPSHNMLTQNINGLTRWKLLRKLHQDFWNRWRNEYLNTLQKRNKWTKKKQESKVGDLVLLKEDNLPPNNWPLARIVNVFPGEDGHVRVVTVKTPSGSLFKRSITKIHPLPINSDENVNAPPNV